MLIHHRIIVGSCKTISIHRHNPLCFKISWIHCISFYNDCRKCFGGNIDDGCNLVDLTLGCCFEDCTYRSESHILWWLSSCISALLINCLHQRWSWYGLDCPRDRGNWILPYHDHYLNNCHSELHHDLFCKQYFCILVKLLAQDNIEFNYVDVHRSLSLL